jgi:Cys-Gly metallodipeptidase DUG1
VPHDPSQSDNYWLNTRTPCLTYGLRGISYFKLTISGPARDLHSGVFGRTVHEPMTDLVALMSKLVDPSGKILIPGIDEMVAEADDEEMYILLVSGVTMSRRHCVSFCF